MSEMLGNHYFLIRNYESAIEAFETAFQDKLPGKTIKKLIICHLANDNFKTARQLFLKLLEEDPQIIIKTDIKKEDCPCPELIGEYEGKLNSSSTPFDYLRLAMLWLYCDVDLSLKYFYKTAEVSPENNFVKQAIQLINSVINLNKHEVN
jgi:tetratricopeptide (TPR) repeat protein